MQSPEIARAARAPASLATRTLALVTTLLLTVPAVAERPVPESDWDDATKLTLAQIMVGEADWHEPDHVAIAFVLARRWPQFQQARGPISFSRYISLYSSVMKVDSKRTRWVRGLPWGEITGQYGKQWSRVVELVEAWGQGKVKDPCPSAEHWGGAMDRPGKSYEPVSCGLTKNIFYTKRDRRVASR
jgi:hypothetical protein